MKRGKKGQFYILAAMVIVAMIAGFAAVSNFAQKRSSVQLYDVGDELNIESSKVLDYGVSSDDNLSVIVDDFTSQYDEYAGEDRDIYFIVGNQNLVTLITYESVSSGEVKLVDLRPIGTQIFKDELIRADYDPECSGNGVCEVTIKIGDDLYDFELKPGENFYFIISQIVGDEQIVVQG